jgi:hypothetical protein
VFLVDDFEDDAWARDLIAQRLAHEMRSGTLSLGSILNVSVWLPAWQLLCAAIECVIPQPYYVPKVLAAIFGGLSPAVVYALAGRLAREGAGLDATRVARTAWVLATLWPWHALYSAIGMSESFYGFWIVVTLYALIRARRDNRWLLLAAFALAPATWTRFEGWLVAALVPLIALAQRRARARVWIASAVVIAIPPVLWLALNRHLTGDPMHFAHVGALDVKSFFAFHDSSWSARGPFAIARHVAYVLAANGVCISLLAVFGLARRRTRDARAVAIVLIGVLAFLVTLWLARRSVGWRRYYVPLGMPLCAAAAVGIECLRTRERAAVRASWALVAVALEMLAVLGFQAYFVSTWVRPWIAARRDAARFVSTRDGTIYCDEPTVRMLSGLPHDRFVNQWQIDGAREHDASRTLESLRAHHVAWLVFADIDYSALPRAFPFMRSGRSETPFTLALPPRASDGRGAKAALVSVYEVH